MTDKITIRIPYSEVTSGYCYAVVGLKEGESPEQYLDGVKRGRNNVLRDSDEARWGIVDSENQSFETCLAEICND